MSGLDLKAIHKAAANKITAGVADAGDFTIKAFPSTVPRPAIEVHPAEDYITYFETSGPEGLAVVRLVVKIYLAAANSETEWMEMARLLSAGTGHTSSVIAALMADHTLGSVVTTSFVGDASWNPQDGTVDIPVEVRVNKIGGPV